jgi:hypothetical protein
VQEDAVDDLRIFDAGDHVQLAAAFRAGLDVDGEYPFHALPSTASTSYRFIASVE